MASLANDYANTATAHRYQPKVHHGAFKRAMVKAGKAWARAQQRQAMRNHLADDLDRIAKDTGITRRQLLTEAGKPSWRA